MSEAGSSLDQDLDSETMAVAASVAVEAVEAIATAVVYTARLRDSTRLTVIWLARVAEAQVVLPVALEAGRQIAGVAARTTDHIADWAPPDQAGLPTEFAGTTVRILLALAERETVDELGELAELDLNS